MARKSKGLSDRHIKILEILQKYQDEWGYSPTIREIGEYATITSTSVVSYYLDQLERWGYIEREPGKIRGMKPTGIEIPETRLLRVFLCHAADDKPFVYNLFKRLSDDKYDPWLDRERILPGQNWALEIQNALYDADVIIVCLSKKSITKDGFVQKEIKFALEKADEKPEETIYIIPARLEECNVPTRLNKWQWVDLFDENGYEKLRLSLIRRSKDLGL